MHAAHCEEAVVEAVEEAAPGLDHSPGLEGQDHVRAVEDERQRAPDASRHHDAWQLRVGQGSLERGGTVV